MLFCSVLAGRALDAGYFYVDISIGILLQVFGMMSELGDMTYPQKRPISIFHLLTPLPFASP